MRYIPTSYEMKKADERTSSKMHVRSIVLMERAALAVAEEISGGRVLVAAGTGNNGGDAFAAGRILIERGIEVDFCLIGERKKCSQTEEEQIFAVEALTDGVELLESIPENDYDYIIDGIFGVSLNRDVAGRFAQAIESINEKHRNGAKVISIDIPSGINADTGMVCGVAVEADVTVACAYEKPGTLLFPGTEYAGRVKVASIGITDRSFDTAPGIMAPEPCDALLPARKKNSNKGTYGKVLVIAGSENICGAALLAARAALCLGCGMVRVFTHENNRTAIQIGLPEALITTYSSETGINSKLRESLGWCTCAVVGPGLGTGEISEHILRLVLKEAAVPLILDADALNLIAEDCSVLDELSVDAVITPHVGEMSRLTGLGIKEIKADPIGTARDFSMAHGVVTVLKDARTVTAFPAGKAVINTSGNSGMATAGSGDVLAGMIGSLTAQGVGLGDAAWRGVYLHGAAGDIASEKFGAHTMLSGDIISSISAFGWEENRKNEKI
ncbi:MAG: NAD(P)H-hydrate dehydratase [Lachnospiraceae bacterium]|nr:NAD(P)H-hydrate dehydratase [Lachnospiraceae bacterium]